jgi:hypothetical protein
MDLIPIIIKAKLAMHHERLKPFHLKASKSAVQLDDGTLALTDRHHTFHSPHPAKAHCPSGAQIVEVVTGPENGHGYASQTGQQKIGVLKLVSSLNGRPQLMDLIQQFHEAESLTAELRSLIQPVGPCIQDRGASEGVSENSCPNGVWLA